MKTFLFLLGCSSLNFLTFGLTDKGKSPWFSLMAVAAALPLAIMAMLTHLSESYEAGPFDGPLYTSLTLVAVIGLDTLMAMVAAFCLARGLSLRDLPGKLRLAPMFAGTLALAAGMIYASISATFS